MIIHDVNRLWFPVINELLNVQYAVACFKFGKPVSEFDASKSYSLPEDLKLSVMEKTDVDFVGLSEYYNLLIGSNSLKN